MGLPENDYQILKLTDDFYNAYPNPPYKEILKKKQRAYNCLLFQTHYDYFICIPYRTEISHQYAFHFTTTARSKAHKSGLDYSKIVIIEKPDYIDSTDAIIDKDEFNETMVNLERIKQEDLDFVDEYVEHVKGIKLLHKKEFDRRYGFSPLKYFHIELGI
ncbi:MAG: type III toxin-antitoxin system TenpIN family toxin [Lachnospira sp.]